MIHDIYADVDARSMTPSRITRSYTLRSVPSSPGRSFFFTENCGLTAHPATCLGATLNARETKLGGSKMGAKWDQNGSKMGAKWEQGQKLQGNPCIPVL